MKAALGSSSARSVDLQKPGSLKREALGDIGWGNRARYNYLRLALEYLPTIWSEKSVICKHCIVINIGRSGKAYPGGGVREARS